MSGDVFIFVSKDFLLHTYSVEIIKNYFLIFSFNISYLVATLI